MTALGELAQLDWRNPWWLLLALQPLLMSALLRLRRGRILRYAEPHLQPWALRGAFDTAGRHGWRNLLAWALLACAAAGPRLPVQTAPEQKAALLHHEMNLMVVLDVSPSMQAQDISPQRLQRARLELLDLLPRLHGERIGLIVVSGSAGVLMPLARDYSAFRHYLALAEPTLFDTPGTNLAAALDLARQTLQAEGAGQHAAILLVSDGEASALSGTSAAAVLEAARQVRRAAMPLYVLGVATAAGATIPLPEGGVAEHDGTPVLSRLDAAGLTAVARAGGGRYQTVEDGDGDWAALYDRGILTLPAAVRPHDPAQAWHELYPWCLFPALLLLAYLHFPLRRTGAGAWLLVGMLAWAADMPRGWAAQAPLPQQAYAAYRNGQYLEAQALYGRMQGYPAQMGAGAAAYRRRDYAFAIGQFTAALLGAGSINQRADALFNLGNAYYAAGNFSAAADAYQGVLRLRPADASAAANLALAAGQRKAGASNTGIPGRRGSHSGGELNQDIGERPVTMTPDQRHAGAEVNLAAPQVGAERARLRSQLAKQGVAQAAAAQAALKKLELTRDQPGLIQKELFRQDAPRDGKATAALVPW